MKNLVPALIKAKLGFGKVSKDAKSGGGKFSFKYATLDNILEQIQPALFENGLVITQLLCEQGLRTVLYHSSGEFIESVHPLPPLGDPQKFGSAITYARRYSICALLNITADGDDDGVSVSSSYRQSAAPLSRPSPSVQSVDRVDQNSRVKQICEVLDYPMDFARAWLNNQGQQSFGSLPVTAVDAFIASICRETADNKGLSSEDYLPYLKGTSVADVQAFVKSLADLRVTVVR